MVNSGTVLITLGIIIIAVISLTNFENILEDRAGIGEPKQIVTCRITAFNPVQLPIVQSGAPFIENAECNAVEVTRCPFEFKPSFFSVFDKIKLRVDFGTEVKTESLILPEAVRRTEIISACIPRTPNKVLVEIVDGLGREIDSKVISIR